jgi:hypothetical protein
MNTSQRLMKNLERWLKNDNPYSKLNHSKRMNLLIKKLKLPKIEKRKKLMNLFKKGRNTKKRKPNLLRRKNPKYLKKNVLSSQNYKQSISQIDWRIDHQIKENQIRYSKIYTRKKKRKRMSKLRILSSRKMWVSVHSNLILRIHLRELPSILTIQLLMLPILNEVEVLNHPNLRLDWHLLSKMQRLVPLRDLLQLLLRKISQS